MKKILIAAAVVAALGTTLLSGPASAQAYLGAGAGAAKTDHNETSWKLYGGFQFNPTWGAELAYTDLGRYRGSDIQSWSLAGTGTMPIADRWSVIGKLGGTSNRPKFAGGSNHSDVLLGIGVAYSFSKEVSVRLEYEDFGKLSKSTVGGDSNGSNLGLSVKYTY